MGLSPRLAAFLDERRQDNEARLEKVRREVQTLTESIQARNAIMQELTQEIADIRAITRGNKP